MGRIPNTNLGAYDNDYLAINEYIKGYMRGIDTCIPVEVVSIPKNLQGQPNTAFVNVKPLLQNTTTDGEVLPITDKDLYYNIPMMTLRGNNCSVEFLASVGDKGLLIASKRGITKYKEVKRVCPASLRSFSFSDGFFLPLDFVQKQDGVRITNGTTSIVLMPESIDITTKTINVNAETANITSTAINLGGEGGVGIARIGDSVENGKIITGSTVVKAL